MGPSLDDDRGKVDVDKHTIKISRLNCCNMNSHFFSPAKSSSSFPVTWRMVRLYDEDASLDIPFDISMRAG